ncbi:MAG TPA: hypothetical protein VI603_09990 [Saprospiraceae bacterium]|nr:hypothetical protein [Saprospiraceae bacterium]
MKQRSVVLLGIFLCLFFGVLIYIVTRSESIYLNQWVAHIVGDNTWSSLQSLVQNSGIPQWVIYSLPDALWMLALVTLVLLIWDFKLHSRSIPWITIAVGTGLLFEIFQGVHLVPGTFDVTDLVFILLAALFPLSFALLKLRTCKTN